MHANPLVSCIMPTFDRRPFIPASVACWLAQDYENRELIVLDDGKDKIKDRLPEDPRIWYYEISPRELTGRKLNHCCELARGEIICRFDDDDWSSNDRISDQVRRLQAGGAPVTGYSHMFFWNMIRGVASLYRPKRPDWIAGTSFCFLKEFWQTHQFHEIHQGSDSKFIGSLMGSGLIDPSSDPCHMVARSHNMHPTWPRGIVGDPINRGQLPQEFWQNEKLVRLHA